MNDFFTFPDPVNERAVRVTAAGVAALAILALVTSRAELVAVIAYGFIARVLAGPRLSPLALIASRVVAPRLPVAPRFVAGPPKRFAQGLGAGVSLAAVVLYYAADQHLVAWVLVATMAALATLEAAAGICVGCMIHAALVRHRVVAGEECAECADVSLRIGAMR